MRKCFPPPRTSGNADFLCTFSECLPRDVRREDEIARLEIPYTVVRAGGIQEDPGGNSELRLAHANASTAEGRKVSRGDLARVLVGALDASPDASLTINVSNIRSRILQQWCWQRDFNMRAAHTGHKRRCGVAAGGLGRGILGITGRCAFNR